MISLNGNDIRRLLLGTLLFLALVSCASLSTEPGDATLSASAEQSPPPSATASADGTQAAPMEESPLPSAITSGGDSEAVPVGIEQKHPADVDNSALPITPVEELHHTGRTQEYDINTYRLVVDGLVDSPLSLTYQDLLDRPQVTETVLLICPGFFWDNAEWTGTPLSLILEEAGVSPEASGIRLVGGDGYAQTLPLEDAMADGVFLAYEVNGQILPSKDRYPIRLVARHQYGAKWVKWVERIEVLA